MKKAFSKLLLVCVITAMMFSLILFKEKLSRRQTFGVIIGATALILLNLKKIL